MSNRCRVEHFSPTSIQEALSLLEEHREEGKIIAGGTDVLRLIKNRVIGPRALINIKSINEMRHITKKDGSINVGTLTSISEIERSSLIASHFPILSQTAHSVAGPQIRHMGTLGGNLCQDVQCWYYRRPPSTGRTFSCCRKGGTRCYAVTGENTYHAIVHRGQCVAVCASDLATTLTALGAILKVEKPGGFRLVPLDEFYNPIGNQLQINELITEIQIPTVKDQRTQRYLKFRPRKAIDFAISSAAIVLTMKGRKVYKARIVIGGVAPMPYRALQAEDALNGEVITESVAERAALAAVTEANPLRKNSYKIPITKVLVKRTILG